MSGAAWRKYLLGINGALELGEVVGVGDGSEKDGLELVHASIGEEESRVIVGDDRGRRDF